MSDDKDSKKDNVSHPGQSREELKPGPRPPPGSKPVLVPPPKDKPK